MELKLPFNFERKETKNIFEELIFTIINQYSIFLFTSLFIIFHDKDVFISMISLILALIPMFWRIKIILEKEKEKNKK